jgi:bifunctional pyridoxal-dependent enzyme with beta-cystathionase and maltose regulon repressor activities
MKDKKAIFVKLAKARVNKTIKSINLIGNLSNKSHYQYTDDQVNQMISALEKELKSIKEKFKKNSTKKNLDGFEFK